MSDSAGDALLVNGEPRKSTRRLTLHAGLLTGEHGAVHHT